MSRKQDIKTIPGPRGLPLIGNARQIDGTKLHTQLYEWGKIFGKIYQFNILGVKYINLGSEELIESASTVFFNRPYHINKTINYDGKGVVFSDDKFIVNETKQAMLEVANSKDIQELCEKELNRLIAKLKVIETDGTDLNTTVFASVCRQVLIYCMGCDAGETELALTYDYLQELKALFDGPAAVLTALPWLRHVPGKFKRAFNNSKSTKMQMIDCMMSKSQDPSTEGVGLIQYFMSRKDSLDKSGEDRRIELENIYAIVVDGVAGSIIPMSAVITSTLLCILNNDHIQERIHNELDQVCPDKPPNDADRDRLPYLTAAILEGFRYITVLTTTVPHTASEDTEFHGYLVEKGVQIMNNLCNLHHDDDIWGDSWTFRPERFLNEEGRLLPSDHSYRKSVKLFGTGPRYCKGNPFGVPLIHRILATILYHFKMLPLAEGNLPDCDPRTFKFGPALEIPDVRCRLEPRK